MVKKKNILLAFFISFLTIAITYVFIKPVLETQDDVFAEFILGNGFSAATIHTTYFEYGFLFYERLFSFLYQNYPRVNWLTFFYILLHLISATFILNILIQKQKTPISIFIVIAYLFLFFIPFITKLSYTTAAAHCIVSCLFVFIDSIFEDGKFSLKKALLVFILMSLAAGLRTNILLPFFVIILPVLFLVNRKNLMKWGIAFCAVALVTTAAFFIHEKEYDKNISNWNNIKNVTNAYYNLNNYGYAKNKIAAEKDSFERAAFQMVSSNFIYDDTLLSTKFLNKMKTSTSLKIIGNKKEISWLFTDTKQYLLVSLTALIYFLIFFKDKKIRLAIFCTNLVAAMVFIYLILFMRLPERIWLPVTLLIFLIDLYTMRQLKWNGLLKIFQLFFVVVAAITFGIQARRIQDIYNDNKEGIKNFICANKILKQYPQNLFAEYNNGYPFNDFPACNLPSQYSFSNILFPFFFNTELRSKTMQHFNIDNIDYAICSSNNIIIVGNADAALADYIYQTQHQKISFEKISSSASCIDLYKVNLLK